MFRSLHMKLALILTLLIISVMAVVGSFLINRISVYYFEDFSKQMDAVFTENLFVALKSEAAAEDSVTRIKSAIDAYSTALGINAYRNYYILDGLTGKFLDGSIQVSTLERTPAILSALNGKIGQERRLTKNYIDRAVPIVVDDAVKYVVYIKDTKQELRDLILMLFSIILKAIIFSLAIAIFLSFMLSKTITVPLEKLSHGTKLISDGEFTHKIKSNAKDEIGVLTENFNDMAGIIRDTLEKIDDERSKLNSLFNHMTDGLIAFSSAKEIIHINPTAERLLHITAKTHPGFDKLFADAKITFAEARQVPAGSHIEKDFEKYLLSLKLFFMSFGNEKINRGVMIIIHDITEQTKLEETRREFVANVSHELRTPLTNIKSYAETMDEMPDIDPETRSKFLKVITGEADRMTRIVQDLLTLSKIDNAKMDWRITKFSIINSIMNVVAANEIEAKNRGHELTTSIDNNIPEIYGDKERIEQVIINVLSNAIKYTPNNGKIHLSAELKDAFVVISVKDNGIGIPKGDIPKLFERFYRVDKARSREMGGTGLGLSIARDIVHYHGGEISVTSKIEVGTTITFTLPVKPNEHWQLELDLV